MNTNSVSLNPAQEKAIRHGKGPMMVLAGPGSGKTFVITRRLLHMTGDLAIPAEHILVITFTKAAAEEMRRRYTGLSGGGPCDIRFGTFHSVFFEIVKEALHYRASDILTDAQRKHYAKEVLSEFPELKDDEAGIEDLLSLISRFKNDGRSPESYKAESGLLSREDFIRLYRSYHELLDEEHKLDFDDMVLKCHRLFIKEPLLLSRWQDRFRYILIDEFQDINPMQYAVVKLLAEPRRNLFIVGDDDQSIYGFRSADPGIMLGFPKDYPELEQVSLSVNYRSCPPIVEASQRLVSHNTERYKKKLKAERSGDAAVHIQSCADRSSEALAICTLLKEARRYMGWRDMALLFRTHAGASFYSQALSKAAIPFYLRDKIVSVYRTPIGMDMLAIMAYAHGEQSRKNLLRFINKPSRSIRRGWLDQESMPLSDLLSRPGLPPDTASAIRRLKEQLDYLGSLPVFAALMYIRKSMGYERWLKEDTERSGRDMQDALDTLAAVCEAAREYEDHEDWLASVAAYEKKMSESKGAENEDAVQLLTMHASKGLEYRLVILPDVNEGNIPRARSKGPAELAEERRLFYVAMTRAKDRLFIFCRKKNPKERTQPSRFIKELS
ncbi:MAG: ATP-dependent helicase [Lachnospiraceae bacterium]|nr:ATP-dependent helicase [Lachnospiraceae bacterium]